MPLWKIKNEWLDLFRRAVHYWIYQTRFVLPIFGSLKIEYFWSGRGHEFQNIIKKRSWLSSALPYGQSIHFYSAEHGAALANKPMFPSILSPLWCKNSFNLHPCGALAARVQCLRIRSQYTGQGKLIWSVFGCPECAEKTSKQDQNSETLHRKPPTSDLWRKKVATWVRDPAELHCLSITENRNEVN